MSNTFQISASYTQSLQRYAAKILTCGFHQGFEAKNEYATTLLP